MDDPTVQKLSESHAMNGGDGPNSYVQNSNFQRGIVESAKSLINEAISKHLDMKILSKEQVIAIADLGCSTGPNTFLAVENLIAAIEEQLELAKSLNRNPEFIVYFNDHFSNDFNTLFRSIPEKRKYFAAGLPGSFYDRLFPDSSVHLFHSSSSLNWLSRVPPLILDQSSPAWNKGNIHYTGAPRPVMEAYAAQYGEDMGQFIFLRAKELATGALMAVFIPTVKDHPFAISEPPSISLHLRILGSCLMDMAHVGLVSEAKVDSFNLPIYFPSPEELRAIIERQDRLRIEKMENIYREKQEITDITMAAYVKSVRATTEGLLKRHFGEQFVEQVFSRFSEKLSKVPLISHGETKLGVLFVLLKKMK